MRLGAVCNALLRWVEMELAREEVKISACLAKTG
jgi:hypothetical protein